MASDILYVSKDYALAEFCPVHMKDSNVLINSGISDKTYYFSYAAGVKDKHRMKARERLREPSKTTELGIGFDIDTHQHIKYSNSSAKVPKRPKKELSLYERLCMTAKVVGNFVSINNKVFFEN